MITENTLKQTTNRKVKLRDMTVSVTNPLSSEDIFAKSLSKCPAGNLIKNDNIKIYDTFKNQNPIINAWFICSFGLIAFLFCLMLF